LQPIAALIAASMRKQKEKFMHDNITSAISYRFFIQAKQNQNQSASH